MGFFCFFPKALNAQNLVPNPSFELFDTCPNSFSDFVQLSFWYNPTTASPNLFSKCATNSSFGVPSNHFGYQEAKSGESYTHIGLLTYNYAWYREYISVKLTDTLEKDSTYCIKFYVSPTEMYTRYTDAIGTYFSKDSLYKSDQWKFDFPSQFQNQPFNYINDPCCWKEIKGYYKAKGGEQFITIGNFVDPDDINDYGSLSEEASVYIDDVSLVKCTKPADENFLSLYPNPNRGTFWVQYGLEDSKTGRFKLFDTAGNLVYESDLSAGERYKQITLQPFSKGLYFWLYQVDGKKVQIGKMVVFQD